MAHNGLAVWFCKPTTPLQSNDKLSKAYKLYRLLYAGRSKNAEIMIHELKILPQYFRHVVDMTKPFEVRREDDRTFQVGDELLLKEFVTKGYYEETDEEHYTGEICHRVITYKLKLADDLVVLGLARK